MDNLPLPKKLTDVKWHSKTKRWFDKSSNQWQARTLYVRGTKGNRTEDYPAPISHVDRLLSIGIFNHISNTYEEVAFSWNEQIEVWKAVMGIIYKLNERQKVHDIWVKTLEEFVHEGGLNPLFVTTDKSA